MTDCDDDTVLVRVRVKAPVSRVTQDNAAVSFGR